MSVFVHAQGIKIVHAGGGEGGSKNGRILSTQLLNDPLVGFQTMVILDPNGVAFDAVCVFGLDFQLF